MIKHPMEYEMPTRIIFVTVYRQYNTCTALTVNGYGEYIVGPAGFKASNVSLRYFYMFFYCFLENLHK